MSVAGALLTLLLLAVPLQAYDYSLQVIGPQTATPGYPLYLRIQSKVTDGERMWVNYNVDTFDYSLVGPGTDRSWGNSTWGPSDVNLKLEIPSSAAPGSYTVTITAESAGVIHSVEAPVEVVAPVTIKSTAQSRQSNADVEKWKARMIEYGQKNCNQGVIASLGTWEGNLWYYDGDRVFQQIAKYLRDDKWLDCAEYSRAVYREYVLNENGRLPGYRVFPHGLFMEDSSDSTWALELLAKNSAFAHTSGGIDPGLSRETAYVLSTFILTGDANRGLAMSFALGHLDQWANGTPYQPFMVGLTMAALIEAYQATGDVRIPLAVQKMLDKMWKETWSNGDAAFDYWSNASDAVPDLNMLIAPAYAWFYSISGDPIYLDRGDQVFNGGVAGAWLGGGKQFSQNYRWSFDYLKWAGLDGPGYYPPPNEPKVVTPTTVPKAVTPTTVPKAVTPTTVPKAVTPTAVPNAVTPTTVPKAVTPTAVPRRGIPRAVPRAVKPTAVPNVKPAATRVATQAACEQRLPTLAIGPARVTKPRSGRNYLTTVQYNVTVSNNDSEACHASSLSLTLSPVRLRLMRLNVRHVRLNLAPGKSSTITVVGSVEQRGAASIQIAATLSGSRLGPVSETR